MDSVVSPAERMLKLTLKIGKKSVGLDEAAVTEIIADGADSVRYRCSYLSVGISPMWYEIPRNKRKIGLIEGVSYTFDESRKV